MDDNAKVLDVHKNINSLVMLVYHIAYCSGAKGSGKVNIQNDVYQLTIAYDPLEASLILSFNGHSDAMTVVVNRPECESDSSSFVNIMHNHTLGRHRLTSNIQDDNPECMFSGSAYELAFRNVPLNITEEELFQLSTVQNVPEIELLETLKNITNVYDFIPKGTHFMVFVSDRDEIHDTVLMNEIINSSWSLLPSLIRK